ncbi:MAG TPA: protein kinase [Candidatus Acidoferrales bacterium]|nr:protein kinase [Candidatus Acidoferrales bacterium]
MTRNAMGLTSGTKLGPYEIQSPLGAGGMGEVYRARDTRLERAVAIKILPAHLSASPEAKQRFDREARAISSLNHPNICTLYDVGHQDGMDYIVMEFLEGETLASRLMKGPLPPEQVLKYGIEICEGLEKAHKTGVIHRDLKPGNIMLTRTGAKLMDFGLAKAVTGPPPASGLTATLDGSFGGARATQEPLTARGTLVGTFQYMSPEQVEGKEADALSDIFSLGAVLYEMASGKRAFEGKTTASVIAAVLERDPAPISVVQPMSPVALDRLVKTCLAKDPDERLQTVHDVKLQLKWIAEGASSFATPAATIKTPAAALRLHERALAAAALIFAIAALALGFAYFHRPVNDVRSLRSSILPPENTTFVGGVAASGHAFSPDGTRLAFSVQSVEGKSGLWVRPLNSLSALQLAGGENGALPFWSPDGQWIGFFAEGKLKKIPASGGTAQVICDAPIGRGGTWSAQGVIVFAPTIGGPLYRVSANGGVPTPATQMDASTGETTHRWPDFLPDGVHFLYLGRQSSSNQPSAVYVGSLDSLSHKKILDALSEAQYAAPGYLVYGRNNTLFAQRFDVNSLILVGEAEPIAGDVSVQINMLRTGFAVSQTGQLVYASSGSASDIQLIVTDRSGKQLSTLEDTGNYLVFRLSPDGQKLAVAETDLLNGGTTTWIFDLRTHVRSRFTFGNGMNSTPAWSTDGSQVAFSSSRRGPFNVYVKPISGAAEERALHVTPEDERPQSWSPDGRFLILETRAQSRQNSPEISVLPLTGDSKPFSFLNASYANSGGQLSRDGRWLAYVSNESGRPEVYVSPFPHAKGKWQVSSEGATTPRWRRDGRELFFCRTDGILMAADVSPGKDSFLVGSVKPLSARRVFQTFYSATYDVFPDGQRFIMAAVKPEAIHAPLTLVTNWTAELRK